MSSKSLNPQDADRSMELFTDVAESARDSTLWQPGQSGNPMGRPKEPRDDLDGMLTLEVTKNGGAKKLAQALNDIALKGSGHVQLAAIQYIYDRLEGKPRQVVPDVKEDKNPLVLILERLISDDRALAGRAAPRPAALSTGPVHEVEVREASRGGVGP